MFLCFSSPERNFLKTPLRRYLEIMSLSNIQCRQFLTPQNSRKNCSCFSKNAQCTIHLTLRKISAYLVVVFDWMTQKALCSRKTQTKIAAKQTENKERKIALQTIFCDLNLLMNETLPKMTNPVEIIQW